MRDFLTGGSSQQKMMLDWLHSRKSRARIEEKLAELEAKIGDVGLESMRQIVKVGEILATLDARLSADRTAASEDKTVQERRKANKRTRDKWAVDQRDRELYEARKVRREIQRRDKAITHQRLQTRGQNHKDAKTREFLPIRPRNGYRLIPSGVFRYLSQLEDAMTENDEDKVRGLQRRLAVSGQEVPTTLSEIAEIRERLKESVNIR